jgi:protein TonB
MKLLIGSLAILLLAGCVSRPDVFYGVTPAVPKVEMSVVKSLDDVDMAPVLQTPAPLVISYPLEMRRAGMRGEVLATVFVEADGKVGSVRIDRASQSEFVPAVAPGLTKCSFLPAKRAGLSVGSRVQVKVVFTFDEE